MEEYLVKTVIEDLIYLRDSWDANVEESTIRRGSVILRRFLVQGELFKAWKTLNLERKPNLIAPNIDLIIDPINELTLVLIIAGGGTYKGIEAAISLMNKGSTALPISKDVPVTNYKFTLPEFINSTSIYIEGIKVTRQEVIQYVANKLGGAHIDFKRQGKLKEKFLKLDEKADMFQFKDITELKGLNAIYFELLSIGQLISNSEFAEILINTSKNT